MPQDERQDSGMFPHPLLHRHLLKPAWIWTCKMTSDTHVTTITLLACQSRAPYFAHATFFSDLRNCIHGRWIRVLSGHGYVLHFLKSGHYPKFGSEKHERCVRVDNVLTESNFHSTTSRTTVQYYIHPTVSSGRPQADERLQMIIDNDDGSDYVFEVAVWFLCCQKVTFKMITLDRRRNSYKYFTQKNLRVRRDGRLKTTKWWNPWFCRQTSLLGQVSLSHCFVVSPFCRFAIETEESSKYQFFWISNAPGNDRDDCHGNLAESPECAIKARRVSQIFEGRVLVLLALSEKSVGNFFQTSDAMKSTARTRTVRWWRSLQSSYQR